MATHRRIGHDSAVYDPIRVRYGNGYSATMERDGRRASVRGKSGYDGQDNYGATASERAANVAWLARIRWIDKHLGDVGATLEEWSRDRSNFVTLVTEEFPHGGYLVTFIPVSDVRRAVAS